MLDKQMFIKIKSNETIKDFGYAFFLFDECLIYCREVKKGKTSSGSVFKFKGIIPIYTMTVSEQIDVPNMEELRLAFEISRGDTQKAYVATALTSDERDRWIAALKDCIVRLDARYAGMDKGSSLVISSSSFLVVEAEWKKQLKKVETKGFRNVMRFGSKRNEGENESTTSLPTVTSKRGTEDASVMLKSQLESEINARMMMQDQVQNLTRQLELLREELVHLRGKNNQLTQELNAEREHRHQVEVELAVEKGKIQGLEKVMNNQSSARPVPPPRRVPQLTSQERENITSKLQQDAETRAQLAGIIKDLSAVVEAQSKK